MSLTRWTRAIGAADGNVHHLLALLGAVFQSAGGEEAERRTQAGEGRAQFMGDGGNELVFHAVERIAFADVGEGDHDANGTGLVLVAAASFAG